MIITVLGGGCASIMNPPNQYVSVINPNKKTRVFVDNVLAGTGDTVPVNMKKDCKMHQVRIEVDSFKTDYRAIFSENMSGWHLLSWLLLVPYFDESEKCWNYNDCFYTGNLRPHVDWTPGMKRFYVDKVSFDIKKGNNTLRTYLYERFADGGSPQSTVTLDSMKIRETNFDVDLNKMLKKHNFIDTTDNIFIDNKNTIVLNCNVEKTIFDGVKKYYFFGGYNEIENSLFVEAELTASWSAMNTFGDTLFTKQFTNRSGSFVIDNNSNDFTLNHVIWDALENTWLDLMATKEMKDLLKSEDVKGFLQENLSLTKPVKVPANVDEAMKASFTIKSDDGHGSGFLVSNDGYLITNYHVINNVKNLKAIDNEGKEFNVKVVRFCKDYDLALLKIEGNFEYAFTMPAEKNFRTGQDAYAIGTPKSVQLGQSLSKGIVSGYRSHSGLNYIQTDISINRGNSGGAVISPAGDLLGVVEYKMFGIGTEGLSFSIPAFELMKALALSYQ